METGWARLISPLLAKTHGYSKSRVKGETLVLRLLQRRVGKLPEGVRGCIQTLSLEQYLCQNKSLQKFWQNRTKLPIHKRSAYKVGWTLRTFTLRTIR
ncbi:DUF4351 domain-containing protein [Nostoc sp.]|uniref:DUF4351 domain-containing protein n=1 Tax=Nostoc sp. TaxID=1180 RepID=UPI002FF5BA37